MDTITYFTKDEVVIHNSQDDIWVIVNGSVFDLTNVIKKRLKTAMNDVRTIKLFYTNSLINFK